MSQRASPSYQLYSVYAGRRLSNISTSYREGPESFSSAVAPSAQVSTFNEKVQRIAHTVRYLLNCCEAR